MCSFLGKAQRVESSGYFYDIYMFLLFSGYHLKIIKTTDARIHSVSFGIRDREGISVSQEFLTQPFTVNIPLPEFEWNVIQEEW